MNTHKPTIYTASKIWHAEKWQALRDKFGFRVIATWIDVPCGTPEDPTGAKLLSDSEKSKLWVACSHETATAEMTVVYAEEGDEMRGALVELGAALACNHPVYLIGDCASFRVAGHSDVAFTKHPLFHRVPVSDWLEGYHWAVAHYNRAHHNKPVNFSYESAAKLAA